MIIFGTKWVKTSKREPINLECPFCGHEHVNRASYLRCVHIYWIPLIPFKKAILAKCPNCKELTYCDERIGNRL